MSEPKTDDGRNEFLLYATGFISALVLTGSAFATVIFDLFQGSNARWAIGVLALMQVAVHFRFFLHIDLEKSHRDDLQLILFTGLIVLLMVGGTLWILSSQFQRM